MRQLKYLLIFVFATVIIFGCQNRKEKRAEKFAENLMEKAGGENVDVNVEGENITIKTKDGKFVASTGENSWPEDIPTVVPEFKFGKIENVSLREMDKGKAWIMYYETVKNEAISEYGKVLKSKNFETQVVEMPEKTGMINAQKGDVLVKVIVGDGGANITVIEEKK